MLIHNQQQLDQFTTVWHTSCTICSKELDFPRYIANDVKDSGYHISCALLLATDIMGGIQEFFGAPQSERLMARLAEVNVLQRARIAGL